MTLDISGVRIFPTVKIYKRLTNGPEDNVGVYYQVLKKKFEEQGAKVEVK